MSESKQTKFVTAGRDKKWTNGVVNPSVQRASTVVFNTVAEKHHATVNRANKTLFYGRRGTTTHFAFQDAMTEIEEVQVAPFTHVAPPLSLMLFCLLLKRAIIFLWSIPVMNPRATSAIKSSRKWA